MKSIILALAMMATIRQPPNDRAYIEWDLAEKMTVNCQIAVAVQFHDLRVYLTTIGGEHIETRQPYLDAIVDVVSSHDLPCQVLIASE